MRQINHLPAPKNAGRKKREKMKKTITLLLASLLAAAGCNTPVTVSGDYSTPGQTISGALNAATNSVTVSGSYATTNQTVGGAVTVGK
jgi:predicted small secreted protein